MPPFKRQIADPHLTFFDSFPISQGSGCFSGFLASMLMAYLLTTHRISNTMSAYQLLRNSLNFLGKDVIYMDVSVELDICDCYSSIPFFSVPQQPQTLRWME